MLTVFTDGAASARHSLSPGGWAWWVDDKTCKMGNDAPTTSNRMELTAVINALRTLAPLARDAGGIIVCTDSMYVVNCFAERWYVTWRRTDWMKKIDPLNPTRREEVKNRDLWEKLLDLYEQYLREGVPVTFKHVRGHGRDANADPILVEGNRKADLLAVRAKKLRMM